MTDRQTDRKKFVLLLSSSNRMMTHRNTQIEKETEIETGTETETESDRDRDTNTDRERN